MKIISPIDLLGNKATNAADPTNPQDLATKAYVDANSGAAGSQQVFFQTTRPVQNGPWLWFVLDESGNITDMIGHTP